MSMQRHGNFDALPRPDACITWAQAKVQYPQAFTDLGRVLPSGFKTGPAPQVSDDAEVLVETTTGAMQLLSQPKAGTTSQVVWIYFPGEGWDGY